MRRNLLVALALAASPGFAHEGGVHVKGTVTAVSADQIKVQGADGKETAVKVTERTHLVRGGAPSRVADVKEGERIVIHARRQGSGLEAIEVHLGAGGKRKNP